MKSSVSIKSIACAVPGRRVGNCDPPFDQLSDIPRGWWSFWGIESRPMMTRDQDALVLAENASREALRLAGTDASDVDLILTNLSSPVIRSGPGDDLGDYRVFPRLANPLKGALGASNAHTLDVEMACLSFLLLVQIAVSYVRAGRYRRVLICSTETMSEVMDFTSKDSTTFGDGAAAALITAEDNGGDLLSFCWGSNSDYFDVATVKWRFPQARETSDKFGMYFTLAPDGRARMMRFVPNTVPLVIRSVLDDVDMTVDDISQFIFHQPGKTLVDSWANAVYHQCGCIDGKYPVVLREYGCLVSAALPLALVSALEAGTVRKDQHVVLAGLGTGWGYGAQLWRWGDTRFSLVSVGAQEVEPVLAVGAA